MSVRARKLTRASALAVAAALLAPLAGGARAQEAPPQAAQSFVVYTQYNPTFVPGESRVHFTVTAFVQNSTRTDFKKVTFRRAFPERFKVETASDGFQALVRRPGEFWQKIENNDYMMFLPELWGGRGTSVFYKVRFSGRPDEVLMPGLEISYEVDGEPGGERTSGDLINIKPYSYFSGSLKDFLKRNAEISVDVGLRGDPWRMAAIDSKALGSNPAGVTGVTGDLSKGYFRLQAGLPGDYRDLLVVWWPTVKDKRIQEEAAFRSRLREYVTWVGLKKLNEESVQITRDRRFKKFRGWYARGTWKDDVPERLGEGPFGAALFFSPIRDAEFMLFWWAQGRGMGPGKSDVPQPEKDEALRRELEAIVDTFDPFRKA